MDVQEQHAQLLNGYILKLVHRFIIVQNRFLQKTAAGLTSLELRTISYIGAQKRCIMREISDNLMIPKNNLTAIINKLVRKQVVERERIEEDRRGPKKKMVYSEFNVNSLCRRHKVKDLFYVLDYNWCSFW